MKNRIFVTLAAALVCTIPFSALFAHGDEKNVKLHINPRWSQCSFQLSSALTQEAWHQFTEEAGLVSYFRPLVSAKPTGVGNFEISILQWKTGIDDTEAAWNDTFVHPDSTHWLFEGDGLAFPGLTFRTGVMDKLDVGAFWTMSPGANYGFWGGQAQYSFFNDAENEWAAAARLGFVSLYGPDDFDFTVYGLDILASKEFAVYSDWVSIAPYAGVSSYLANSHETAAAVDLKDEHVLGVQGMVGAVVNISFARLAVEYNVSRVNSLSFRIGAAF